MTPNYITDIAVPKWNLSYVYSANDIKAANEEQQAFYSLFKTEFLKGNLINLQENYNYGFVLMFDLVNDYAEHNDLELLKEQYRLLEHLCPKIHNYSENEIKKLLLKKQINEVKTLINKTTSSKCKWIPLGQPVGVQGIMLTRGGIYIGEYFKASASLPNYAHRTSCSDTIIGAVINPNLQINKGTFEEDYFISYYNLSPELRYHYLLWLSSEVDTSIIPESLLNLYLFGIQVRIFIDNETTNEERKHLIYSLMKLQNELSDKSTVVHLINEIIDYTLALFFLGNITEFSLSNRRIYNRILTESLVSRTKSIDADMAYKLFCLSPSYIGIPTDFRKYVKNHILKNFRTTSVSTTRYSQDISFEFPILSPYKSFYCPEGIEYNISVLHTDSDIFAVISSLNIEFEKYLEDFNGYNKIANLLNNPLSPLGILSLPKYINNELQTIIDNLISKLEMTITKSNGILQIEDLLSIMGVSQTANSGTVPKIITDQLIACLCKLKYNIIPNYQLGHPRIRYGENCVIYHMSNNISQYYNTIHDVELIIKLISIVMQADGITLDDFLYVDKYLLSIDDEKHLFNHYKAFFRWLTLNEQKLDNHTKDEIGLLDECIKQRIVRIITESTYINGEINENRLKVLQKLLPNLREESNVHTILQRVMTTVDNDNLQSKHTIGLEPALDISQKMLVFLTSDGNLKKCYSNEIKHQKFGSEGHNRTDLFKSAIKFLTEVNTQDTILLFSEKGNCYRMKVSDVPLVTNAETGIAFNDRFDISNDSICYILSCSNLLQDDSISQYSILIMTRLGKIARHKLSDYKNIKNGFQVIVLDNEDSVSSAALVKTNDVAFNCTCNGQGKAFYIEDLRITSLKTKGVKCSHIFAKEYLLNIDTRPIKQTSEKEQKSNVTTTSFLLITKLGYISRVSEFFCDRAIRGLSIVLLRDGDSVVNNMYINDSDDIIVITRNGSTIRLKAESITERQRGSKGTLGIKLKNNDEVVACCKAMPLNSIQTENFVTVEKVLGSDYYSIPNATNNGRVVSFNGNMLKNVEQQTKEAHKILSEIFSEEESSKDNKINDLEYDIVKEILSILFNKEVWSFKEFETICIEKGQMANNILERINDYAYATIEDAVIEQDDEQLYVTLAYKDKLL